MIYQRVEFTYFFSSAIIDSLCLYVIIQTLLLSLLCHLLYCLGLIFLPSKQEKGVLRDWDFLQRLSNLYIMPALATKAMVFVCLFLSLFLFFYCFLGELGKREDETEDKAVRVFGDVNDEPFRFWMRRLHQMTCLSLCF